VVIICIPPLLMLLVWLAFFVPLWIAVMFILG
jgi:hypothetical protein